MSPVPVSLPFADRAAAGRALAARVRDGAGDLVDPVVLALPRGGVPVAAELAADLGAPLDVLLVRKIGLPSSPELGVGALAEDGTVAYDHAAMARLGIGAGTLSGVVETERGELERRLQAYRGDRPGPVLTGRDVIVVDDGVATGGTARAALRAVRRKHPARTVLAVPVAAPDALESLRDEADEIAALSVPVNFHSVGEWYRDFGQLDDAAVRAALERGGPRARSVRLGAARERIDAELTVPGGARGAAVVAARRGATGARLGEVAAAVAASGPAVLALDPVTGSDDDPGGPDAPYARPADTGGRILQGLRWLRDAVEAAQGPVALYGAGEAAPGALAAAAEADPGVSAVVVLGGRIDLAEPYLHRVTAPVLVLVPGDDSFVRELAEWTASRLGGPAEIRTVSGAEQLLPGGDESRAAGEAAAEWFRTRGGIGSP